MKKNYWWETPEITNQDIYNIVSFYNDCAVTVGCQFKGIKFSKNKKLQDHSWYLDVISLVRLINSIDAKPKEFITAQFILFKKTFKNGREIPTFRMMTTPAAIERWHQYMINLGLKTPKYEKISQKEMDKYNRERMRYLMEQYHIIKEEDFFKDPTLISQLSRSFVEKFETYKKLVSEGYYQKVFGIEEKSLFV